MAQANAEERISVFEVSKNARPGMYYLVSLSSEMQAKLNMRRNFRAVFFLRTDHLLKVKDECLVTQDGDVVDLTALRRECESCKNAEVAEKIHSGLSLEPDGCMSEEKKNNFFFQCSLSGHCGREGFLRHLGDFFPRK